MNSKANYQSSESPCHQCGSSALALDKFCRRCGARRQATSSENEWQVTAPLVPTRELDETARFTTAPLQNGDVYHAISAPLVKALTGSLTAQPSGRIKGRWSKGLLAALISLPVWLMIVLLSPLDAYAAVRATVEQ
ncbi:MAG: hypothetical protein ACREEM_36465 [Blastocatellia bacterium]